MLSKWIVKALAQGVISSFPRREQINYKCQKLLTGSLVPSRDALARRLRWCGRHLEYYRRHSGGGRLPTSVLELGTGWFPGVPIGLYLCGVDRVYSIDIQRLIEEEYFLGMIDIMCGYSVEQLQQILPDVREERLSELKRIRYTCRSPVRMLAALNIEMIVTDARQTMFPDGAIVFVISNTTLEHIAYECLLDIFRECHRIMAPDGLMSHLIDLSDHYQHFDQSITMYNFLQYSDFAWRLVNNRLHYQNRLREPDYRHLHRATGFRIVDQFDRSGSPEALARLNVARRFRQYSERELLVYQTWIVSRPVKSEPDSMRLRRRRGANPWLSSGAA